MLIQRLLAAIVLIPLVIIALFFLPLYGFVAVIALVCGLALWEWTQFLSLNIMKDKLIFIGVSLLVLGAVYCLSYYEIFLKLLLFVTVIWWILALCLVMGYPNSAKYWHNSVKLKLSFAFFTIAPFFISMIKLREIGYETNPYLGAFWLLYILVLIWATDSGAYFAGRMYGKKKLAPSVSPGKTIEGLAGGAIVALSVCLLVYLTHLFDIDFQRFFISSVFAIFVSVLGDLVESMFKREANIKDSGNLIPGHGGILDRIDSLTAAIPIFLTILLYLM